MALFLPYEKKRFRRGIEFGELRGATAHKPVPDFKLTVTPRAGEARGLTVASSSFSDACLLVHIDSHAGDGLGTGSKCCCSSGLLLWGQARSSSRQDSALRPYVGGNGSAPARTEPYASVRF
jgi:hypothetical protein